MMAMAIKRDVQCQCSVGSISKEKNAHSRTINEYSCKTRYAPAVYLLSICRGQKRHEPSILLVSSFSLYPAKGGKAVIYRDHNTRDKGRGGTDQPAHQQVAWVAQATCWCAGW